MATISIALHPVSVAPTNNTGSPKNLPAFFFLDPAYTKIGDSAYSVDLAVTDIEVRRKLLQYANAGFFVISGPDLVTLTASVPAKPVPSHPVGYVAPTLVKGVSTHVPQGTTTGIGGGW